MEWFGKLSGLQTNNANIQYFTRTPHTCKNKNKSLSFFPPHPLLQRTLKLSLYLRTSIKNKKNLPKNSISVISVMRIKTKMVYYVPILILRWLQCRGKMARVPSPGEGAKQPELSHGAGGKRNGTATLKAVW